MEERLQKHISAAGICSRRRAEELILAGRVLVNGRTATLGERADPKRDEIVVDGKKLSGDTGEKIYILLNKPRGYVTTLRDERGRRTVAELVSDCGARLYPVGRLDMNSEGLLLLTNDGDFANRVAHPACEIDKEYHVSVSGDLDAAMTVLLSPMELDGRPVDKPKVTVLQDRGGEGLLSVVIHEGRNRQVRRMCDLAGLQVRRLVRVREGALTLGSLKRGQWRRLTRDEAERVFRRL